MRNQLLLGTVLLAFCASHAFSGRTFSGDGQVPCEGRAFGISGLINTLLHDPDSSLEPFRQQFFPKLTMHELLTRLKTYTPERVTELRRQSLLEQLRVHGAEDEGLRDGYELLRRVSARNLQRLLGFTPAQSQLIPPFSAETQATLARLRIHFEHNTAFGLVQKRSDIPLLSSRQIQTLGGKGGFNTHPFSTDILRSDDNVFFFMYTNTHDRPPLTQPNEYGTYQVMLRDVEFARKEGWISPFVMYQQDLRNLQPLLANGESLTSRDLVARLHAFDFTLDDFRTLVSVRLGLYLDNLQKTDPLAYRKLLDECANASQIGRLLKKTVFDPLHIPFMYEFKVPVLVPIEALEMRKTVDLAKP